jgi:hypothetical protein
MLLLEHVQCFDFNSELSSEKEKLVLDPYDRIELSLYCMRSFVYVLFN